jgi:tubulin monoglycylase TTLL3/8
LALDDVVNYFKAKDPNCPLTLEKLVDQMGSIVVESISTVKDKLTLNNPTKTFQLLGYDFLLDWEYKMWLIEANCNPCLEESSALLGKLLRQMLSGLASLCQGE